MGKLFSLFEVAARTSTSVAFWRKAIGRKQVPVVRIGRLVRVREEDVDACCRLGLLRESDSPDRKEDGHADRG